MPRLIFPFALIVGLLAANITFAQQIIFSDDFEDEDISQNPEWTGNTDHFTFFDDAGNTMLRLGAPAAGTSQLRTSSPAAYGSWEFFIDQDFPPSNGNRGFIFLMSDQEDLTSTSINGYAIRTGENSSPNFFRLFRFTNGNATEILTGDLDISTGGPYQVRVTRDDEGEWALYESTGYGSTPTLAGTATDNTHTTSSYFGMRLHYTSTRTDNFYFDDIIVSSSQDFEIVSVTPEAPTQLDVAFTYPVDIASINASDFSVNGVGSPQTAVLGDANNVVRLTFAEEFDNDDYTLTVSNIENVYGTAIAPDSEFEFTFFNPFSIDTFEIISNSEFEITFSEDVDPGTVANSVFNIDGGVGQPDNTMQPVGNVISITYNDELSAGSYVLSITDLESVSGWPIAADTEIQFSVTDQFAPGDIILNEFFYRPPTSWRTPEFERPMYIELRNVSEKTLDLQGWTVNGEIMFTSQQVIEPEEFLVITRGEQIFRDQYGNRNFVEAENLPVLSLTTTDDIELRTDDDVLVEELTYVASTWGGNEVALERISADVSASFRDNWAESTDPLRGSPGLQNTVTVPTDPPTISEIRFSTPDSIIVRFSRTLSEASRDINNFSLTSGDSELLAVDDGLSPRELYFEIPGQLTHGQQYQFTAENIEDIFGNAISGSISFDVTFSNPFQISSVNIEDGNRLRVTFNQSLEVTSVSGADFELEDGTAPTAFSIINSEIVELTFPDNFASGPSVLLATDIEALDGWLLEADTRFTFYLFAEYEPGDIVVNEFYMLPPSELQQNNARPQYFEIRNTSNKYLNLGGWEVQRISGNPVAITNSDLAIEPESYLVISGDTTVFADIFGSANYFKMQSFPRFNLTTADMIVLRDNDGATIDSVRVGSSGWKQEGVSTERRSASAPSFLIENWGFSEDALGGTPSRENSVSPPSDPPEITEVSYAAGDTVYVRFGSALNESIATDADRFAISGGLSVEEVIWLNHREYYLALSDEMTSGTGYTLTVNNVEDIFGNVLSEAQQSFTYYQLAEAGTGDVVINEFMFRPPEGYTRYVELYNTSSDAVNVQNWTLNNDSGTRRTVTSSRVIIPPDSFLVLLEGPAIREVFPDMNSVVLSNMPALKTGGDDIVIRNAAGVLLDSLSYQPNWGGSGVSLERRDPTVTGIFSDNWADSPALEFGTPGSRNQVEADTEAPELVDAYAENQQIIRLIFSKVIGQGSAEDTDNYSFSGGQVADVNWQNRQIFLTVSPNMTVDETYTLTITGLQDLFGNALPETTTEVTLRATTEANERDVVINEFLYRPEDGGVSRFVELYNRSNNVIDINDWIIGRGTGSPVTIRRGAAPDGTALPIVLEPDEFIILTGNSNWLNPDQRAVVMSSFPALSSLGDAIFIRNRDGVLIDSLQYSNNWGGNEVGLSVERRDPNGASNDPSNWLSSTSPQGYSAGRANEAFSPITDAPRIRYAGLTSNGNIRIMTNRFIELDNDTEFMIGQNQLNVQSYSRFNASQMVLNFSGDLDEDGDVKLVINNLKDFAGNTASSVSIPISRPIAEGDVVINEILYQTLAATEERPGQSEFIEFYNTRDYAISMEGFGIHDGVDPDGSVSRINPVGSQGAWIPSGGYLLFHAEPQAQFSNSRVARFFEIEETDHIFRANRTTLSLSTTGDDIYLVDSTNTVIDQVSYLPTWHNPNRVDVRGVSLERINPYSDSNDNRNWSSSTRSSGATPGSENTIFSIPSDFSEDEGVVMEPNPFSPDGDGHEDNLFINYTLDESDYLLRVRIFDRYGRLVRTLADGQVAGLQGTLIWDGMKDDGSSNRIGIYVVLFEAYNSATGRNRTFKETVVLARQL